MLLAAAFMGLSVYKTPALEETTAVHLAAALAAQGIDADAAGTARALLFDALGPGGGHGERTYKCLSFQMSVAAPDRFECRPFRLAIEGMTEAAVEGTLCPHNGVWTEARGEGMISSIPLDLRWRDATVRKGAALYREPDIRAFIGNYGWPDLRVQVGGYSYRQALTFAHVRLPNGDTHFILRDDLDVASARRPL